MPTEPLRRNLVLSLLGVFLGLLPLAGAVAATAATRGELGRALLFLLPVLGIGLVATLLHWLTWRARAAYDRHRAAGRLRWWQVRP